MKRVKPGHRHAGSEHAKLAPTRNSVHGKHGPFLVPGERKIASAHREDCLFDAGPAYFGRPPVTDRAQRIQRCPQSIG
jgi:hypothetical protein